MSERLLSRDEAAVILRAAQLDPKPLIESSFWIRDTARRTIRFQFNEAQRIVHARFQEIKARGEPIRVLVLKSRKHGISTLMQGYAFASMLCRPGTTACVIAHERDASQLLLGMSAFFFNRLPAGLKPVGKPTQNSLYFKYLQCADGRIPLDSRLIVDTATGKESGRSKTIHFLHASECAFYPDPERTLTGILQSVPLEHETCVVLESTANGVGDDFNDRWDEAEKGTSGYEGIFLGWPQLHTNRQQAPQAWEPSKEECQEQKRYHLDREQLFWRHQKIEELGEWKFKQEHPATAAEAFVTTGQLAYSQQDLLDYRAIAKKRPYEEGHLDGQGEFHKQRNGPLRIYRRPEPDHEYMIGADTSLGVQGGSDSAAAVIDRNTHELVADLLYLVDPHTYASHLAVLGKFYNTAILSVETNNTGLTTQVHLTETIRYPKIYVWRWFDKLKNSWTNHLGWQTNTRSRPLMIDETAWGIKFHIIGLPSVRAIDQLIRFDADRGGYEKDDLAMAVAIAWMCHIHSVMKDGRHPLREKRLQKPTETVDELDLLSREEWKQVAEEQKRAARGAGEHQLVELSDAMDSDLGEDPWPELEW